HELGIRHIESSARQVVNALDFFPERGFDWKILQVANDGGHFGSACFGHTGCQVDTISFRVLGDGDPAGFVLVEQQPHYRIQAIQPHFLNRLDLLGPDAGHFGRAGEAFAQGFEGLF
nr:hypothetical protein [Tanacetum cinerariifolium]